MTGPSPSLRGWMVGDGEVPGEFMPRWSWLRKLPQITHTEP